MATNKTTEADHNSHKRKIFVQKLSSATTKRSLENYFSNYPIDWCAVPIDEETGQNRKHGIVVFLNEDSVDAVMSQHIHQIDGKEVFIHRADPTQRSVKDNYGIQQLIVTAPNHSLLFESVIQNYFSQFGDINRISHRQNGENTWTIDFDYYDSADKAMLASPHRIEQIDVSVKRGDRNVPRRRSPTPGPTAKIHFDNSSGVIPKKSNLKEVRMNDHVSCLNLPEKKYHIHIKDLPANIDAETLSEEFEWDVYDIVMDPSVDSQTSLTQCWLKNVINEGEVNKFVRDWNGKHFRGSIIQCEKDTYDLEFCNKFQFGICQKSDEECHWDHVACTAQSICSSDCRYGHIFGTKSQNNSPTNVTVTTVYYRIKLTGFKAEVTPENLSQRFGRHNYYVDRKHDRVGYVVKIKTMKYAKQLMTKWHNKDIDGQKIRCQLEFNPESFAARRARSRAGSTDGELNRYRRRSLSRDARSLRSSQDTSDRGDVDNTISGSFDNREVDRDRRICGKAFNDITRAPPKTNGNITTMTDTKYWSPSDALPNEWEITVKAPHSDGKVLLIRHKTDRKRLATIKTYPNQTLADFNQEIDVLKELKDVQGVVQLIKLENASNNSVQRRVNSDDLWMLMERAPGYSLKEFIERKCQGVLEIPTAIRLTLNLIKILQQIHGKGIFHQNLSPENIMIECGLKSSTDRAQLTILNFNQALIVSSKTPQAVKLSTHKWYSAPQIDEQGLSSTVDSTGSCAILFWLLTQIDPRHDNDELPHQQTRHKLNNMITSAIKSTSTNQQTLLEEQVKRYLMNTFDRAFGYPHHHPWTINDLECRLESILQLLTSIDSKLNTIDGIFQELIAISDSIPTPPMTANDARRDAFEKASKALYQAKKHFLKNKQNQYEWSDGRCTWVHSPHSSISECHHDDVLTYYSLRGRTTTPCSIIVTCLASCSEEGRVMTLSICSNINGKTIQIPIGQYSTAQDYNRNVEENFLTELTNLLLAVYKERKPIEQ